MPHSRMRQWQTLAAVLLLLGGFWPWPGGVRAAGIVEHGLLAESPVLGHPIKYSVYRPFPSPDTGGRERWPVVYLLHGLTGHGEDWFSWGNLGPILDQALAEGKIRPMVVVAPDSGDSWYVDDADPGSFGLVETAIAQDLVAAIDKKYPTAPCRGGRAIGGLSMGGYGAVNEGIDHPELFAAVIGMSPALYPPLGQNDPRRGWTAQVFAGIYGRPFSAERFNAGNPFNKMGRLSGAAHKPQFYLTIGDQDVGDFIEATARFHDGLRALKVKTFLRIGPGRHYWDTWQQAIVPALQWVTPIFDTTCSG